MPKIKKENTGFRFDIAKHIKVGKNHINFNLTKKKKYEEIKIELPNFMDIF